MQVINLLYTRLLTLHKKATIHQVTIMLATSKNVLFPGYNHLLTTSADDSLALDKLLYHMISSFFTQQLMPDWKIPVH